MSLTILSFFGHVIFLYHFLLLYGSYIYPLVALKEHPIFFNSLSLTFSLSISIFHEIEAYPFCQNSIIHLGFCEFLGKCVFMSISVSVVKVLEKTVRSWKLASQHISFIYYKTLQLFFLHIFHLTQIFFLTLFWITQSKDGW